MNCDLMLTEDSCRFCLGNAQTGSTILCNKNSYFCVDKRLILRDSLLKFLDITVYDETQMPNVPSKICLECKKTLTDFYSLKKNYVDNEAVLMGKTVSDSNDSTNEHPQKGKILPALEEFLLKHLQDCLRVERYTDRLVICQHEPTDKEDNEILSFNRPWSEFNCTKCTLSFPTIQEYHLHEAQCLDQPLSIPDENTNDSMDIGSYTEADKPIDGQEEAIENEEYLEEEENEDPEQYDVVIEPDLVIEETSTFECEVKEEETNFSTDRPFLCFFCDKRFISRSGRDTHQQLTHRKPAEFRDDELDTHEIETVLETGELKRVWKCPTCGHLSKKKNHHQTHLIRHAIKKNEEIIKQEAEETCLVISDTQSLNEGVDELNPVIVLSDTSPEHREKRESNLPMRTLSVTKAQPTKPQGPLKQKAMEFYGCTQCSMKFRTLELAESHLTLNHAKIVDYVCESCNVVFITEKMLKRHQDSHVLSSIAGILNFFECATCQVLFGNKKDMDLHMTLHQYKNYQYEPETVTKFDGCEIFVKENEEEGQVTYYHCAYCVKSGERNDVNLHMALFHGNLVCPLDKRDFSRSLGYFVDHMKTKHPEQFGDAELTFCCPHCKQKFPSRIKMTLHCRECKAKSISCNHCDKKFALLRHLKKHLILVNGTKEHNCAHCEKSFVTRTELNIHNRSHTNEKPYRCTFPGCQKAFRTNSHRSAHMDLHNMEKSYECNQCSVKFQTRGARRVHEKQHASNQNRCRLCHKEFKQRSHYVRHVNSVHHIKCNSFDLEIKIVRYAERVEAIDPSDGSNQ